MKRSAHDAGERRWLWPLWAVGLLLVLVVVISICLLLARPLRHHG